MMRRCQEMLGPEWLFRRAPKDGTYKLAPKNLQLNASPEVTAGFPASAKRGIWS